MCVKFRKSSNITKRENTLVALIKLYLHSLTLSTMRILINARFLIPGKLEGIGLYTYEVIRHLALTFPQYHFVLCVDRSSAMTFDFGENVSYQLILPPARHPLLFIWWFEIGIPRAYVKHQADLFFSPDGFCSLNAAVRKTLLVIHDLAYLHFPHQIGSLMLWYYRRYTPRFLQKADVIVAVSQATGNDLKSHFPEITTRIEVVYNGVRSAVPSAVPGAPSKWEVKLDGRPYFMALGSVHPRKNITGILSAFEEFKRSDPQNTCLLIVGRMAWKTGEIRKAYRTHPFRDAIIFSGYLPDAIMFQALMRSLALIYVSFFEGFGLPIVEAMSLGVPVITSNRSSMPEIAGEAALLADPDNSKDIAAAMKRIAEDPDLRTALIEAGVRRAGRYCWEETARALGRIIETLS